MRWPPNLLLRTGFLLVHWRRKPNRSPGPDRFVNGLDHPHVEQALISGWFRIFVLQNAIREVDQLGGKLVPLGKSLLFCSAADRHLMLDRGGVSIRWIGLQ